MPKKGFPHFQPVPEGQKDEVEAELQRLLRERLDMMRSNWRPLFSYTANLERVGDQLLNTESAWIRLGELFDPATMMGGRRKGPKLGLSDAEVMAAQHPWPWSAAVLVGLFGVSVWILTFRVKSLDRLK
jgi:hypothetical protein